MSSSVHEIERLRRDLFHTRGSLVNAVGGLVARGEKLERLAQLGTQLSDFAGEMSHVAARRSRITKFRVLFALSIAALCLVPTAYWVYANSPPNQL